MDALWNRVYEPTIRACDLTPLRSDKEEDGRPLPTQIRERIIYAAIVIADLTFARPNCYYEVGLSMALKDYAELILCCREDHNSDSKNFKPGVSEQKVHFDVSSYNVVGDQRICRSSQESRPRSRSPSDSGRKVANRVRLRRRAAS
jgi:hypothetical protein